MTDSFRAGTTAAAADDRSRWAALIVLRVGMRMLMTVLDASVVNVIRDPRQTAAGVAGAIPAEADEPELAVA